MGSRRTFHSNRPDHPQHTATTNDNGAPAEYDTAIDTSYQHNLGIQKGWIK